jgi:hypothetical protein
MREWMLTVVRYCACASYNGTELGESITAWLLPHVCSYLSARGGLSEIILHKETIMLAYLRLSNG